MKLSEMPNIGKVQEEKLYQAGIHTPEELRQLGAKEAFLRVRLVDPGACISSFYALEGAIRGIRWHDLQEDTKADLRAFFRSL